MKILKGFCIFFAVSEIFGISIYTIGLLRDIIIQHKNNSPEPTLTDYLIVSGVVILEIVLIIAAIFLYKGITLEKGSYFIPWLILHGLMTLVFTGGCFYALFSSIPTGIFTTVSFCAGILWAKWITVYKCNEKINHLQLDSQMKTKV